MTAAEICAITPAPGALVTAGAAESGSLSGRWRHIKRLREQFESSLAKGVKEEADRRQDEIRHDRILEVEADLREEFDCEISRLAIERVDEQEANERPELEEMIERQLRSKFEERLCAVVVDR